VEKQRKDFFYIAGQPSLSSNNVPVFQEATWRLLKGGVLERERRHISVQYATF